MSNKKRVVVVGAGMSGILAAVRLKEASDTDFVVYEKAGSIGGTWRENRYPGLTCDVPAHCYTYSFAPHPDWSAFYAGGPEIRAYFEKVVDDHDVRDHIRLNSEVTACEWDGDRWQIGLRDGTRDWAIALIVASGVLHHPNIPEFEGQDDFDGPIFHSTHWDYSVDLDGKRIGVVGTGSTGVQIVSALSRDGHTDVVHLQRSPQWVLPVEQIEYSDAEREAFRSNPGKIEAIRQGDDYWAGIRRFNEAIIDPDSPAMAEIERLCLENLERIGDPELREKLRPDYRAACKRLVYSWEYYDAVQRPNVTVETGRIERFEKNGVRMQGGTFHKLDVVALATGFHADMFIKPTKVIGRDGIDLDDFWDPRPTAHYAVTLPGFPNLFMLNGPTGPVGNFSLIDIAERQWGYIEQLLAPILAGKAKTVEPTVAAHADYEERRIEKARKTVFGSGCTSWYLDKTGIPATWPWSYDAFAQAMDAPKMEDYHYEREIA